MGSGDGVVVMAREGRVTQWLPSPQGLHLLGPQKWPPQIVEGACIFLISAGERQQSFRDDLSDTHCESGCRKSRLARVNRCCVLDELVNGHIRYTGDSFANKGFLFLIRSGMG